MPDPRPRTSEAPESAGEWLSVDEVLARIEAAEDPLVALSITGGGASGAYQAGVLTAIAEAIERRRREKGSCKAAPRLVVGTSAGALNAFGLLLGSLGPAPLRAERDGPEPFVASLWRTIGARNRGARFVTGRRARLVDWMTRWRKWRWLRHVVLLAVVAAALALINPVLFGVLAVRRAPLAAVGRFVLSHPVELTTAAAVLVVVLAFLVVRAFGRSLFGNEALRSTLAAAARARLQGRLPTERELLARVRDDEQQRIAMELVRAWASTPGAPEVIFTATDLTARWECLFALASPERCALLASNNWEVGRVGPGAAQVPAGAEKHLAAVHEADLLRCVVASTSIPGVFPSQRIRMHRLDGSSTDVAHDYVDGGVLNNSPMNVAVDAGATHVISIELDPLREAPPLDAPEPAGGEPLVPENLARTLGTLLNLATTEDVYRTIATNLEIAKARTTGKRVVEVFRIAPVRRKLETLDFNGHFETPFSGPSPSLVEWMQLGALDARGPGKPFWRATYQAWPR